MIALDRRSRLEDFGVRILVNQAAAIWRGRERLYLLGVDDAHYFGCNDLPAVLAQVPRPAFKILLAHSPEVALDASAAGVGFYLCGDTHGGQISLPWIGPVWRNARVSESPGEGPGPISR